MTATIQAIQPYLDQREFELKLSVCEVEAGWFFDRATAPQKAEYTATMASLQGCVGPRWNRERDAAKAKWHAATSAARALYDRTVECLLACGEVSEQLDGEWTAMIDRSRLDAVAEAMVAAE